MTSPLEINPANRLPPELLEMVFQYLRGLTELVGPLYNLPLPVFNSYEPVRSAVPVCRKWYVVASEKASPWTEVVCSRERDGCISSIRG